MASVPICHFGMNLDQGGRYRKHRALVLRGANDGLFGNIRRLLPKRQQSTKRKRANSREE